MKHTLLTLTAGACAVLIGCGGGSTSLNSTTVTTLAGKVIDGYIKGAVVCLDTNSNQKCDGPTIDPQTVTADDGSYSFTYSGSIAGMHVIAEVPKGAVDSDLGEIKNPYSLLAPASASANTSVITPLTTLVSSEMLANKTTSAEAEATVKANLNLATQLVGFDFKKAGDPNATAVAQITAAAIASATSTLKADPTITSAGLTPGEIVKKAVEQVKDNVLPQVLSSTGKVTIKDATSQDAVIAQVASTVTNTLSGQVQNIVSSTKSGDGKVMDIAAVFKAGLVLINGKENGQYKDTSGQIRNISDTVQVEVLKFDASSKSTVPNYRKLLNGTTWVDRFQSSENVLFDGGQTWIAGVNDSVSSVAPVIHDNCVDLAQALNGSVVLSACGLAKDLSGKMISEVMPDFCKDKNGKEITGCNPRSTFPSNSMVYDFTISYKNDTYDLNVGINWDGFNTYPPGSNKMADLIASFQRMEVARGNCSVGFMITEYNSATKKGKMGWRDTTARSCANYQNPAVTPTYTETTNFDVRTVGGKDVLVFESSNIYRSLTGNTQAYEFFAYHAGSTKSGFWNGDFIPARFRQNIPFSGYIYSGPQAVSPTVMDFMVKQLGLPTFTYPQ